MLNMVVIATEMVRTLYLLLINYVINWKHFIHLNLLRVVISVHVVIIMSVLGFCLSWIFKIWISRQISLKTTTKQNVYTLIHIIYFLRSELQVALQPTQAGKIVYARFPDILFTTVRREDLPTFLAFSTFFTLTNFTISLTAAKPPNLRGIAAHFQKPW